jgi:reactive intermediate/imine deaminase
MSNKTKQVIETNQAPSAIGPYSQAIKAGDYVYISGQIPLDPEKMTLVSDSFDQQAKRVFQSLQAIVTETGGTMADVIKINLYLTDLSYFGTVNELMAEYFKEPYPARAAIEVSGLPKGAQFEAEAVVYLP